MISLNWYNIKHSFLYPFSLPSLPYNIRIQWYHLQLLLIQYHQTVYFSSAPERHARPLKKIKRVNRNQKKCSKCTRKSCIVPVQDTKSTQPVSLRQPVQLLKTTNCQIGWRVSIRYLKRHWHTFCFFWFFEFILVYTVLPCITEILSIHSKIQMSTMWSVLALQ